MSQYELTITNSEESAAVVADATINESSDGRKRVVWNCDDRGRGVSCRIRALSADAQAVLHRVNVYVVPSYAGDED